MEGELTGQELRALREGAGVNQTDIALTLGCDLGKLSRIERGLQTVPEGLTADYRRIIRDIHDRRDRHVKEAVA